jgi:hypothetical protein
VRCIARFDGVVGGDLLDRLAATDRLHDDLGLEFGTVGEAFAQLLRIKGFACGGSPLHGRCPSSKVDERGCPEKPDHHRLGPKLEFGFGGSVFLHHSILNCNGVHVVGVIRPEYLQRLRVVYTM